MRIYGAGLAGLITANMLRMHKPTVHESQDKLPDNHGALLRFRSNSAEIETGIKLKKVNVDKCVFNDGHISHGFAPIQAKNSYSQKVTGACLSRSINSLDSVTRYIAPDDFIEKLSSSVPINFSDAMTANEIIHCQNHNTPIISTIPMPVLMDIVGWHDKPEFHHKEIWSLVAEIDEPHCDVYQTVYDASADSASYRFSITGNKFIVEFVKDPTEYPDHHSAAKEMLIGLFGFHADKIKITSASIKHQYYGKLLPIDEQKRRSFILAMSNEMGIYSVGRFATWRQLLIDDIIKDVRVVEQLIVDKDKYNASMLNSRIV